MDLGVKGSVSTLTKTLGLLREDMGQSILAFRWCYDFFHIKSGRNQGLKNVVYDNGGGHQLLFFVMFTL
jgi:hypothetical protein